MNETIKLKIKAKDNIYKKYIQSGRFESDFVLLETLITELNLTNWFLLQKCCIMKVLVKS